MCGENGRIDDEESQGSGSPPRVWGKLRTFSVLILPARITPTCVGKTLTLDLDNLSATGSPPRVWGKRYLPCRNALG